MKRVSLAILVVLSILAVSCGNKQGSAKSGQPTSRLLTDATGIDDKSFNAAAWRGILSFYGDTWEKPAQKGKLYDVVTAQTQDMYVPNLKQASDEKYDLIIVTGFTFQDALTEVAPQYPKQNYMIVDVEGIGQPNIMEATFSEHEGSYLVGVAAALKAKADNIQNPKFGFIGGVPSAVITKFEMGWVQGIRSVYPNASLVDYYANDWGKPELAKAQAKNWYDSGVYAIFSAAGGTGGGTINQAKEYRAQGKNVWAIGVDSDQYEDGIYAEGKSAVLTSMLKRVESATQYALQKVKDKSFKGETVVFDTKSDGVGFSDKNAELGQDIVKQVNDIKAKIVAGEIKVIPTYAAAKEAGLAPDNLQALDD
ncbi:MAG: BMP family protein [Spirochaetaceae bacterium]|nr:BMP family protein [Spirochaetaceae bacterium]